MKTEEELLRLLAEVEKLKEDDAELSEYNLGVFDTLNYLLYNGSKPEIC